MLRFLSPRGEIPRGTFVVGAATAAMLFWMGIQAALAALPWMAEILAPRGVNAGFALNVIWLAVGLLFAWALIALFAKRLRTTGASPWLAPLAVLPLGALALFNDAIFLVSRTFVLPPALNWLLIAAAAALTLWITSLCLRRPPP